jgi:hypothetical protein
VKELLWELHKDYAGPIEIKTINLLKTKQKLLISTAHTSNYSMPNGIYMNLTVP